jgi:hypothetical protein
MSANENGSPRPDGLSVTLPFIGLGGAYYWNPGSATAPAFTLTGGLGMGGGGVHAVFLRPGMTSTDTLGYGASADISAGGPSAAINSSIPDKYGIPLPRKAKVSSVGAGIGLPGFAGTYTATPQQISDAIVSPAGGPQDELSSFVRTLQTGHGTIGQSAEPPVRFPNSRYQNPLGNGMAGWPSSVNASDPPYVVQPSPSPSPDEPSGLLGRLLDHLRDYPEKFPGDSNGPRDSSQPAPSSDEPGGLLGRLLKHLRNNPDN